MAKHARAQPRVNPRETTTADRPAGAAAPPRERATTEAAPSSPRPGTTTDHEIPTAGSATVSTEARADSGTTAETFTNAKNAVVPVMVLTNATAKAKAAREARQARTALAETTAAEKVRAKATDGTATTTEGPAANQ